MRSTAIRLGRFSVGVMAMFAMIPVAHAGDKPIYAAVPAWVKSAPPIDTAKLTDASPILLVFDNQTRMEDGQTWTYLETASRAASNDALRGLGTIAFPWQPEHGDLIIHRVEILRGTSRIDLLNGKQPFNVLRREQQIEQNTLDGKLTATMQVEGLQLGDVLRVAVSVSLKDPTLKGHVQSGGILLRAPFRVDFARSRFIWPSGAKVKIASLAGLQLPPVVSANGYDDLSIPLPLAKEDVIPKDAPARFQQLPLVESSDFQDWASVSAVMAPLYATDGLIDPQGPIAAEIRKIMASHTDPLTRAAAALQLVQDQIRYQLIALNSGNYVPQSPAQTWSVRYGDCKAKTLLLLAILRNMGIEAEAVMASTQLPGLVTKRLPAPAAFDHVFVKARINGEDIWLDGTDSGSRLADIHDVPPVETVLPIRAAGAALLTLPRRAVARAGKLTDIIIDSAAGIRLPAIFTLKQTFRGRDAQTFKTIMAQGSKDDIQSIIEQLVGKYIESGIVASYDKSFDDIAGTATFTARGVAKTNWVIENEALANSLYSVTTISGFSADRSRPAWQAMPVATPASFREMITLRTILPNTGAGFILEGDPLLDVTAGGIHVRRVASLANGVSVVASERSAAGEEIPASAIPAERKLAATLATKTLRQIAPATYPTAWEEIEQAKRNNKTAPIAALLTLRITDKPDEHQRYSDRADFYSEIFDREKAVADLTKAISLSATADYHRRRAEVLNDLGQATKAIADASTALELDPKQTNATTLLAELKADSGDFTGALALLKEKIDLAGDDLPELIATKAEILADSGDVNGAISLLDETIVKKPGNPLLLNARCWAKGTRGVMLETGLKDCTKSIELSDFAANALDSRAMIYLKMGRLDDALADLKAALDLSPLLSSSLFMRGVIRRTKGDAVGSASDLRAARGISPRIDKKFRAYGLSAP